MVVINNQCESLIKATVFVFVSPICKSPYIQCYCLYDIKPSKWFQGGNTILKSWVLMEQAYTVCGNGNENLPSYWSDWIELSSLNERTPSHCHVVMSRLIVHLLEIDCLDYEKIVYKIKDIRNKSFLLHDIQYHFKRYVTTLIEAGIYSMFFSTDTVFSFNSLNMWTTGNTHQCLIQNYTLNFIDIDSFRWPWTANKVKRKSFGPWDLFWIKD